MNARKAMWTLVGVLAVFGLAETAEAVDGPYFARSQYGPYGYYHAQSYLSTPNTPPYYALHPPIYYGRGIQPAYTVCPYFAAIYGLGTEVCQADSDRDGVWGPQLVFTANRHAKRKSAAAASPTSSPPTELVILNPYAMKTEAEKAAAWESLPVRPEIFFPAEDAKRSE